MEPVQAPKGFPRYWAYATMPDLRQISLETRDREIRARAIGTGSTAAVR
jgi:hypothetical protein